MARGRPKLPEGERLVHVSLRLPQWLVEWYDGGKFPRSARMRRVLEDYASPDDDRG
jgi:hypothetical protein